MILFLLLTCIGLSIATNNTDVSNSTVAASPDVPKTEAQFEVFSLDSYSLQRPLIIRSRISDLLQPPQADAVTVNFAAAEKPQNESKIVNYKKSIQAEFTLPSQQSAFQFSTSNVEFPIANSKLQPTIGLSPILGFVPLNFENSFAIAPMPIEEKLPESFFSNLASKDAHLLKLTPAQSSNKKIPNLKPEPVGKIVSSYVIEEVPMVATFSKSGPFYSSDIPSIKELEAIFSKAASDNSKNLQKSFKELIDERSNSVKNDGEESITENINETTDSPTTEIFTSKTLIEANVDEKSNESNKKSVRSINKTILNEENDLAFNSTAPTENLLIPKISDGFVVNDLLLNDDHNSTIISNASSLNNALDDIETSTLETSTISEDITTIL